MGLFFSVLRITIGEYLTDISITRIIFAVIIASIFVICTHNIKNRYIYIFVVIYYTVVLIITVFGRTWFCTHNSLNKLFYTYCIFLANTNQYEIYDIIFNIVLFIPTGIFSDVQKKFLIQNKIAMVFLISLGIEFLQLITGSGLFEICDLIDNTLGGIIGIVLLVLYKKGMTYYKINGSCK